jgi:hypothetical protein
MATARVDPADFINASWSRERRNALRLIHSQELSRVRRSHLISFSSARRKNGHRERLNSPITKRKTITRLL